MKISGITYVSRKTHKMRNTFILLLVLVLLGTIAAAAISVYNGWKLLHPEKAGIPPFEANMVPEFKDAVFTDIKDGIKLKGWFFEAVGSDRTIILAHGYGKNRLQFGNKTFDMIKSFLSRGCNVLAFDFRNCGLSGGNLTSMGYYEKNDLLGAVKYVKSRGSKHIVLLGFAAGASTSILAAADEKGEGRLIEAVIADSPFSDLKQFLEDGLQEWTGLPAALFNTVILNSVEYLADMNLADISPRSVISKIAPRPIFFIHSKDDAYLPIKNSRDLYDTYSGISGVKALFWETQGAGHARSYEKFPQEYMKKIFEFLDNMVYVKK